MPERADDVLAIEHLKRCHEVERLRLEVLELADALEAALEHGWLLPMVTKRWARRLIKRTRERHLSIWQESVAGYLAEHFDGPGGGR